MSDTHCPYFTLRVGEINLPGNLYPLRVPICRCALTEVLVARVRSVPEGQPLASLLMGPPLGDQPRPVIGSDLEPISQVTCTPERLQARCLSGFDDILSDFGLDTSVPEPPAPQPKPSR